MTMTFTRMTKRSALAMVVTLACVLLGHAPPVPAQAPPAAATGARLVAQISQIRSDQGSVRCLLFASATGFPNDPARAVARVGAAVRRGQARCVFENITVRPHAVAVHHDEDGEGDFDTGLFGIPTEGVGASRDAHGSMGPPSYEDARINVVSGENRIRIRMSYP